MEPINGCLDFPGEFPFVGRQDILAELDNAWKENHLIFGIYGLRSVGKSRTVREFLKRKYNDIKSSTLQDLNIKKLSIIQIDLNFIHTKETLYSQLCASLGILPQGLNLSNTKKLFDTFVEYIGSNRDLLNVFIFENAEKTYEISFDIKEKCTMKDELQKLCVDLVSSCTNVRIFLTSTTQLLFAQTGKVFYKCELKPMPEEDSTQLLTSIAPKMRSHACTKKIVNLCCGLPLALIIVGSNQTEDGIMDPMDFMESLTECRLKALSNEHYPKEDRIGDLYSEFLLKLTFVFQQRLAVLGFIPGTFNAKQATEILDEHRSVALTKNEVLVPLIRKSMLMYHQDTKRLDIHGILRDCLAVYATIEDLPGVRKKYCRIFKEEMEKIARQIDSREYTEALAALSLEYPNLQKLLRLLSVLEHIRDETYPFLIQISATCSSLIEKFLAAESEKFYECSLRMAKEQGQARDEAIVRIAYSSMLTNSKGDFSVGESHYREALKVLKNEKSSELACLYLKLGDNLYFQWRGEEAYRYMMESLAVFEGIGLIDSDMSIEVFNLLGLVLTLNGKFDEGKTYHFQALSRGEEKLGMDHPLNCSTMNNLGIYYEQLGDMEKAFYWHERALETKRKINAPPESLYASLTNTALQYSELGEYAKAEQLLNEAKTILYQGIPNMATLGAMYDNFGQIYFSQKKYNKALTCVKKGLEFRQAASLHSLKLSHAESLAHLSKIYITIGDYKLAIAPAETVLSLKEKLIGRLPQVRYIYQSLKSLLTAYSELGMKEKVQELYKDMEIELMRLISVFEEQYNFTRAKQFTQKLTERRSSCYAQTKNDN